MDSSTAPAAAAPIRPRAIAAAAAIAGLLAVPRSERGGHFSPIAAILPELAEAQAYLAERHPDLSLLNVDMADGSGFAEVRHGRTYGVILSSERYPDSKDRVARLTALAEVAQRVLAGELDA